MPTIFDNAGLKSDFEGRVLPAKYFGRVNGASVTTSGTSNTTIYALEEMDIEDTDKKKYHIKPGMLIPAKVTLSEGGVIKVPSYEEIPRKKLLRYHIPNASLPPQGTESGSHIVPPYCAPAEGKSD